MAQKILKHSRGLRDHKMMHPEREWLIGLAIALSLFTITAYASIYTYWKDKNMTSSSDTTVSEDSVTYRASLVRDALKRFETRNKEREDMMSTFSADRAPVEPASDTSSTSIKEASSTAPLETATSTGQN